jgi:Primase C terminal 2 (PriCT-2)
MSSFAVTFFPDDAAKAKTEESLTLEALAQRIKTTTAPSKDRLPWLKYARFGNLPSPKGSLRWNANVVRLSGAICDYDAEKITPEEATEKLDKAGIIALVYTSPSHLLNGHGPRWRVCCPFQRELPPDRHYQMVARLNGLFRGALAPESFTLSQAYYFGAANGNPAHDVIIVDGPQYLDQADELDLIAVGKPDGDGKTHAASEPEAAIEDIRAALSIIPNPLPSWGPGASWNEWNTLGMAVWRASGGSHEGFEAFDEWSKRSPKYDREETEFVLVEI